MIAGTLTPERLAAPVPSPSLFKRLLGTAPATGTRVTTLAGGDILHEIEPGALGRHLVHDFREWLHARLPSPSEGTALPLQYVVEIEPSVYVRGLQRAGENAPRYNVQLSFSGCAGEAETSARVAAHWASLWYRAEHERVANAFLRPFGFEPAPYDPALDDTFAFLPARDLGYLELVSAEDSSAGTPGLELDYSTATAHEDDPRLERLNELYGHYMKSGRCRCQLCEPEFGDARVEI